jgi:hypothetical protein
MVIVPAGEDSEEAQPMS